MLVSLQNLFISTVAVLRNTGFSQRLGDHPPLVGSVKHEIGRRDPPWSAVRFPLGRYHRPTLVTIAATKREQTNIQTQ